MIQPVVNAYRRNILVSAGVVDMTITQTAAGSFDPARVAEVRATDGIASATGLLRHAVVLPDTLGGTSGQLNGVGSVTIAGLDPVSAVEVRSYPLVEGRFLEAGDSTSAVITESLALNLGLQVGDRLALPAAGGVIDLQVVGLLTQPLTGGSEIYVPLSTAQQIFNEPGKINTIEALYASGAVSKNIEPAVLAKLGPGFQLGIADTSEGLLAALKMGEVAITLIGVLALAMAGFITLRIGAVRFFAPAESKVRVRLLAPAHCVR